MTDQTPSLDDFRQSYETDSNAWWRLECGHHMNLFDAALEALDAAREAIDAMQTAHESQLTRMAKERARLERKVERLKAELEAAQRPPLGYVVASERGNGPTSFHRGFYGSLATALEAVGAHPAPRGVRNFVAEIREVP